MRAIAHPVRVRPEHQMRGLLAEVTKKLAFRCGFRCGVRSGRGVISRQRFAAARQADAYVGGLDSGAVGEKEIAKNYCVGDAKGRLTILVVLLDAIF